MRLKIAAPAAVVFHREKQMTEKPVLNLDNAKAVDLSIGFDSKLTPVPQQLDCCATEAKPALPKYIDSANFQTGAVDTPTGPLPRIATELTTADRLGTLKVRINIGRLDYAVRPGLYAVGSPDENSQVLVSANYKLSFDALRRELSGRNLWIIVLETYGINVWCAAGKGTFGTLELTERIEATSLPQIVRHRRLIVPQLGAPGIAAHEVKQLSGFSVIYGPIEARDLPYFLDNRLKAQPEMRRKMFTLAERAVLIPVELVVATKSSAILAAIFLALSALGGGGSYIENLFYYLPLTAAIFFGSVIGGAVLVPLLLPWIPGKAFAVKGLALCIAISVALVFWQQALLQTTAGIIELAAAILLIAAMTTYLAMNFTGASTYTSMSGVRKEMRVAVPLQIVAGSLGLLAWFGAKLF
jgi:CO dehydrogenase/acetyl-CoA synthase delta subunit